MTFRTSKADCSDVRRQRGAYAVEYAFIFPLYFLLFYGALAYGMIFTMRLSLQHAAEEGARAALQYQRIAPGDPVQTQVGLREVRARQVAAARASWMNGLAIPTVAAEICPVGTDCLPNTGSTVSDEVDCGTDLGTGCQVVVTVTYPYSTNPVFPALPGLGLLLPSSLQGRARVLLDGRSLTL